MIIEEKELYFLLSITSGAPLYGVSMTVPGILNVQEYIKKERELLIKDKLIEDNEKLTEKGLILAKLIDTYRHSQKYLQVNHIYIGLNHDNQKKAVVITKTVDHTYDISYMFRTDVCAKIILENQRFGQINEKSDQSIDKMHIERNEWLDNMKFYEKSFICVNMYDEKGLVKKDVYYWSKKASFRYDVKSQLRYITTSEDITKMLLMQLEAEGEKECQM